MVSGNSLKPGRPQAASPSQEGLLLGKDRLLEGSPRSQRGPPAGVSLSKAALPFWGREKRIRGWRVQYIVGMLF